MWRKKSNYLILALLALLVFVGLTSSSSDRAASTSPDVVKAADFEFGYREKPSPDPIKFAFIYWTSGFSQQPVSQYTYLGQTVTLSTKMAYNLSDSWPSTTSYQWYDSQDTVNWGETNNQTKQNLTIKPSKVGTQYYQASTTKNWILSLSKNTTWYSKVAFVTTYPEPKDATSVKVSVDSNYLYNNLEEADTTFAHATPDPYDSTAKLSWSIDNTDLATIDANTGEITANTAGKSGDC